MNRLSRRTLLAGAATAPLVPVEARAADASADPILGVDRGTYPGDDVMKSLLEKTKRRFTGIYLTHWNPANNRIHEDDTWITSREGLAKHGWGFLPTFMGKQPPSPKGSKTPSWPTPSADEGTAHGKQAATLMQRARFGPGSVVYLDVEFPVDRNHPYAAYLKAWQKSVAEEGFYPGVYCSYLMLPWVKDLSKAVWMFEMPAGSTVSMFEQADMATIQQYDPSEFPHGNIRPGAICTQYLQERPIEGFPLSMKFDSNNSHVADPSNLPAILQFLKIDSVDLTKF